MKKLFVCGAALALLVACSGKKEEVRVLEATCEKMVTFAKGDMLVKCPGNARLSVLRGQMPMSQFSDTGNLKLAKIQEMARDTDHLYINVIPKGAYDWATKLEYRVLVKEPADADSMYSVRVVSD